MLITEFKSYMLGLCVMVFQKYTKAVFRTRRYALSLFFKNRFLSFQAMIFLRNQSLGIEA